MLADRDYMRDPGYRPRLSATAKLMVVLVAVFMAQMINDVYVRSRLFDHLVLQLEGLKRGHVWQLVTYQFLHGGLVHLLFNLLGLWFVGRVIEHFLGAVRMLYLYIGGGLLGGILQMILSWSFDGHFAYGVVGASAGLFALLAAFCLLHPEAEVQVMMIFPLKARWLYYVISGIALFFTLVPPRDGIAHAAHLGGILFGTLFIRQGLHHDFQPLPGSRWALAFGSLFRGWTGGGRSGKTASPGRRQGRGGVGFGSPTPSGSPSRRSAATGEGSAPAEQAAMSARVDVILEKIAAQGIQSLTDEERRFLEEARRKMTP